ncbi:MAG: hypothetical protein VX614_08490 [Myxococcota bacterium]|nr:hypothetical protein [Myxococcota bacterium]
MRLLILIACLSLWAASSNAATPTNAPTDATTATPTNAEIVDQIYRQVTEFEEKFPATYSRRNVTLRELDPDDGEVRKTKTMVQAVWAHVGERARVEILSCAVDGEASEIEDCKGKDRGGDPPYRIFGPDGHKHYRFELGGPEQRNDLSVYELRVIPREKTSRHFEGELYFTAGDLRLVRSKGTLADYPLGLSKLAFDLSFDELDGQPVPGTSKMDMTLYLPLILNVRVVSESAASEQRLLAAESPAVSGGPPEGAAAD